MGVRILQSHDDGQAVMYCSTTGWAFGPVIDSDGEGRDGETRMLAFFRWMDTTDTWDMYEKTPTAARLGIGRDPRRLTDAGMEDAYADWLAQESSQYAREDAAELAELED